MCLYPDFRGHGRTRCNNMKWDSAMIADDMICFLDKKQIEKVNLIGYSTGGGIAYYMALKYPERVFEAGSKGLERTSVYKRRRLGKNYNADAIDCRRER